MFDILICGGNIVDGTGESSYRSDIGIIDEKIAVIDIDLPKEAKQIIDAKGQTIIPGFIDPHTHEELVCLTDGSYEMFLRQGVTTVVTGNCSHSIVPGLDEGLLEYYYTSGLLNQRQVQRYQKQYPRWNDFEGYCQAVQGKTNINLATLMGHGSIRFLAMQGSYERSMDEQEWHRFETTLRHNMEQGAWGISFGLDYLPSRAANMDELCKVVSIIQEYDAVAAAHLRHQLGMDAATQEFLDVGEQTGCRLQVSHLQSTDGKAFDLVKQANQQGIRTCCDIIPRSTGHCMSKERLRLFLASADDALFRAGEAAVVAALQTTAGRELLKTKAYVFNGQTKDKFIVRSSDPSLEARSVFDIASERGVDPSECFLDLVADENDYTFWMGGPIRPNFTPHLQSIPDNPFICVGTDQILGDIEEPNDWYELQRRCGFATFMQSCLKLGMSVEEIVRRNTTMLADHFGIKQRGKIDVGYFADIIIFDPKEFTYKEASMEDYKHSVYYPAGIDTVVVNGKIALKQGDLQTPFAGQVLKK